MAEYSEHVAHFSVKKYYSGEQLTQMHPQETPFATTDAKTIAQRLTPDQRLGLIVNPSILGTQPAHYFYVAYMNHRLGAEASFAPAVMQKGYDILLQATTMLTQEQRDIIQRQMELHHSNDVYERLAEEALDSLGPAATTEDEWVDESDLMIHRLDMFFTRLHDGYKPEGMQERLQSGTLTAIEQQLFPHLDILMQQNPQRSLQYLRSCASALGFMSDNPPPQLITQQGNEILQAAGYPSNQQ